MTPAEMRAELEALDGLGGKVAATLTAEMAALEAAGECIHCGASTAPDAALCDGCECSGDGCELCEAGPEPYDNEEEDAA